jgi:16S rRNA (cytosine967-C5)-methyltransferase
VSRYYSYCNTAQQVINQYNGAEPLANYLKKFFAANKKIGGRDRKHISQLCYCWYRAARLLAPPVTTENLITALFICSQQTSEIVAALAPPLNETIEQPIADKLQQLGITLPLATIFPYENELSADVNLSAIAAACLQQPDLFIRIRPGHNKPVIEKLKKAGIAFKELEANCVALPATTKLETIIAINKEAVVQDYSSQQTGSLLQLIKAGNNALKVWDCCAASGGKSIMAVDIFKQLQLTVSDIRQSILMNLQKRFETAGIKNYHALISDLSKPGSTIPQKQQQLIICDAPCSGSGTWSRTPEQLFYFKPSRISEYSQLQKSIALNAVTALAPCGYFLYITCSVFKQENEMVVAHLLQNTHLQLIKQQLFTGYHIKADTLFAALFVLPASVA